MALTLFMFSHSWDSWLFDYILFWMVTTTNRQRLTKGGSDRSPLFLITALTANLLVIVKPVGDDVWIVIVIGSFVFFYDVIIEYL